MVEGPRVSQNWPRAKWVSSKLLTLCTAETGHRGLWVLSLGGPPWGPLYLPACWGHRVPACLLGHRIPACLLGSKGNCLPAGIPLCFSGFWCHTLRVCMETIPSVSASWGSMVADWLLGAYLPASWYPMIPAWGSYYLSVSLPRVRILA